MVEFQNDSDPLLGGPVASSWLAGPSTSSLSLSSRKINISNTQCFWPYRLWRCHFVPNVLDRADHGGSNQGSGREGGGVSDDTGAVQGDLESPPSITVDVRFYPLCRIGNGVPNIPNPPVSGWRERKKKTRQGGGSSRVLFFLSFLTPRHIGAYRHDKAVQPTSAMTKPPPLPLRAATSYLSCRQYQHHKRRAVTPRE